MRAAEDMKSVKGFRRALALGLAGALWAGTSIVHAISWDGGITAVYQYPDDDRVDDELTGSADLIATIPRTGGEWLIYVEASTTPQAGAVSALYPTANADAGSVIDRDGDGGVQISELNYTFRLDGDRTLMVGLIDPSAWLDRSRATNDENQHFVNGSFVNNATIEFPDYTLGGVVRWIGNDNRPEVTLVAASSDGLADVPDRSYQDLLDIGDDQRGGFLAGGASWLRDHWSTRLGAWVRTDDHTRLDDPEKTSSNYGAYGVLGWQANGHVLNARIGLANDRVSVASGFMALAYERQTRWGLFGAGVARSFLSDEFTEEGLADTTDAEIFFRVPVAGRRGHVTPSIQYLENPGFDASGARAGTEAIVAGVRFRWNLAAP